MCVCGKGGGYKVNDDVTVHIWTFLNGTDNGSLSKKLCPCHDQTVKSSVWDVIIDLELGKNSGALFVSISIRHICRKSGLNEKN